MLVFFVTLVIVVSGLLVMLLVGRSNYALRKNASNLIAGNNRQMELNINSYLKNVEKASSLLFSDDTFWKYDPTDETADQYEQLQISNRMSNYITDLGLMDNYTDFGVVYKNDDVIGWLSKTTRAMYIDGGIYDDYNSILEKADSDSAWIFGLNGNIDRIYYFKRYNDISIIVVSFYSNELKKVFQIPEQLTGMNVLLIDEDNSILYSNIPDQIGQTLPEKTVSQLSSIENGSVMTRDTLYTTNECLNGWKVVCTLPAEAVLKDNYHVLGQTLIVVLIIVALFLFIGIYETRRMSSSAGDIVDSLQTEADHDQLTGLYNKIRFQDMADRKLQNAHFGQTLIFTIMDIDNFKGVNDRFGHLNGDLVLQEFAEDLRRSFGDERFFIGRLGGDEFGIFGVFDTGDTADAAGIIRPKISEVRENFQTSKLAETLGKETLSFSSGTIAADCGDTDFLKMYTRADMFLYESKKNGKDRDSSLF